MNILAKRSLATRNPNQTFQQQDRIISEKEFEVVNDNFLNLFFILELDFRIERANESEEHREASYNASIASVFF